MRLLCDWWRIDPGGLVVFAGFFAAALLGPILFGILTRT